MTPTVSPTEVRPTIGSPAIAPTEPALTPVEPAATRPPAAPESTPPAVRPAFTLGVEPVASGFERPTYVTHAGDDRLFVVEQAG
ncbi:MAG TPA: glucose dehydrogenase, partial [Anaerolineae bacterium]|nr:glucose dehydrogenase [Anaerolineae bacterium]